VGIFFIVLKIVCYVSAKFLSVSADLFTSIMTVTYMCLVIMKHHVGLCTCTYYYAPAPVRRANALSDNARLTSDCLSRTSGLSREQSPRKTKISTEVAHVTGDLDTTFKVKRSKVNLQGRGHIVAASRTACFIGWFVV